MALINCKECNTEISSEAFDCPKCGARLRKPSRSVFGVFALLSFIGFNIIMSIWFLSYVIDIGQTYNSASSEAAKTGTSIGAGIGIMFLLIIWVCGASITGIVTLLTRPKK
jgi:hypothetical protein